MSSFEFILQLIFSEYSAERFFIEFSDVCLKKLFSRREFAAAFAKSTAKHTAREKIRNFFV
jgi:hypothetical protein